MIKTKTKKRVGRGTGSGKGGHTIGRGMKGQKSRSGYKKPRKGFEGGSMPLSRRLPKKRGFSRKFATVVNAVVSLDDLSKCFEVGELVSRESLANVGLISSKYKGGIKILNNGKLDKKLKVDMEDIKVSKSVEKIIEKNK